MLAPSPVLGYSDPSMLAEDFPGPDPERPTLSASQADTYLDCARRWAWKYLEGIEEPPNSSANLGSKCHTVAEKWLKLGHYPNTMEAIQLIQRDGHWKTYYPGQIIQAGLHFLPPPGIALVEGKFQMSTRESDWTGYRDAQFLEEETPAPGKAPETYAPDPIVAQIPGIIPVVLDHKTTSDFRWMKTEEILRKDIQAVLYAAKTMEDMCVRRVRNRWVYYRTSGQPEARKVEVEFTVDQVAEQMDHIDATAKEIHQLYRIRPKALDVAPNPDACERYGGCPHVSRCNLGVVERMTAQMAKETIQEMMERKRREREALEQSGAPPIVQAPPAPPLAPQVQAPPVPAQVQPPPAPQVAPQAPVQAPPVPGGIPQSGLGYWKPGDPLNPAQEWLQGQGKPLSIVASAADSPPPEHIAKAYDAGGVTERGTINPPEAPPVSPPTPAHMPPAAPVQAAPQVVDDLTTMQRDPLKVMAMQMGLVDSSSRLREDSLRAMIRDARARGISAQNPAQLAPQAPQAPAAPSIPAAVSAHVGQLQAPPAPSVFQPPPAPQVAPQTPPSPAMHVGGFFLLVNALPSKGMEETITLEAILAEAIFPRIRQDTGLPDYRLEDYGKGPGRLAAYLDAFLQEVQLGPDSIITVDAHTDEGRACLSTLTRHAAVVIRGL